jgi:putative oxidoreductase
MKHLLRLYTRFAALASHLRSPLLLAVRLYWGWQFIQTGWGKLHNLAGITSFFASLNIPFPACNAYFVSGLEFFGGMLIAYYTADHAALVSIFSDPDKFYAAAPYTFLCAALLVLIFGPGLFSADELILRRLPSSARSAAAR